MWMLPLYLHVNKKFDDDDDDDDDDGNICCGYLYRGAYNEKHFTEAFLMSTHNICFLREIRKKLH